MVAVKYALKYVIDEFRVFQNAIYLLVIAD